MRLNTCGSIVVLIFLFIILSSNVFAESDTGIVKVNVISIDQRISDLHSQLLKSIKTRLTIKGVELTDKVANWTLLIDATPIEQLKGKFVVVSIIILKNLPKDIVEYGKKAEIFYSNLSAEKRSQLSPEGKSIREAMSEEYISQFALPSSKELRVIPRSTLDQTISEIVDKFCLTYLNI
jgi:hypothetical protein